MERVQVCENSPRPKQRSVRLSSVPQLAPVPVPDDLERQQPLLAGARDRKTIALGVANALNVVRRVSQRVAKGPKPEPSVRRRATRRARRTTYANVSLGQGHLRRLREKSADAVACDASPDADAWPARLVRDLRVGLRRLVGLDRREKRIASVADIIKEPVLEDLELPHRYRPENLNALCDATGFSVDEMKRIYRGFKTECPSGLITEETFHSIYSRFFPQGAGVSSYAHFVFSTLDPKDAGIITFRDFVLGLSTLVRGSVEDRLKWAFSLYDQDRDGLICREELEDVVGSVFDLMGRTGDPSEEERIINDRVDFMIEKLDLNGDGVISLEEFLEVCQNDELIRASVNAFTSVRT